MKLWKEKGIDDYTVVIGCGRLGANLATSLTSNGQNVVIIDTNKESFRRLPSDFKGECLVADGTNLNVLTSLNLSRSKAVIIVTNNDNTNIMIAQMARHIFKVDMVIARLYDPKRECVYREFGIDTICPTELSAKEVDNILHRFKSKENEI